MNQGVRDTVRDLGRIAVMQASVARTVGNLFPRRYRLHEWIHDRPPGHSDRTLHDRNIIFLSPDIGFLVPDIRIAFLCGNESRGDLNRIRAKGERMHGLLPVLDPAAKRCRNLTVILFFILLNRIQNLPDFRII